MQGRGEQEERILLTWPNFQIEVFAHWKARQLISSLFGGSLTINIIRQPPLPHKKRTNNETKNHQHTLLGFHHPV